MVEEFYACANQKHCTDSSILSEWQVQLQDVLAKFGCCCYPLSNLKKTNVCALQLHATNSQRERENMEKLLVLLKFIHSRLLHQHTHTQLGRKKKNGSELCVGGSETFQQQQF